MESDDAVDMLGELDEERRTRIIALLPPLQARRVRALAGYDPATAGGLMSPDFICLYSTATKSEALARIRRGQIKRQLDHLDLQHEPGSTASRRDHRSPT